MGKLDEVTYVPDARGGRVRTTVRLNESEFASVYPVAQAGNGFRQLLEQARVTLEEVTYKAGDDGAAVQVLLDIGGHRFAATLPVDSGNTDLKPLLDRLVQEAEQAQLNHVQNVFGGSGTRQDVTTAQ